MSRYKGSSARSRAEVAERYPAVNGTDSWPNPRARALYAAGTYRYTSWCAVCHRAWDAKRERGVHRRAGEGSGIEHGGPTPLYCSEHCASRARDRRHRVSPVWRKCQGCGTSWVDYASDETDGKRHRPARLTCPPAWTPGETRLYSLLRSPCEDDPETADRIEEYRRHLAAQRRRPRDERRRNDRADKRAAERANVVEWLRLCDGLVRATTSEERDAILAVAQATGMPEHDPVASIDAAVSHLNTCRGCRDYGSIHRYCAATRAAAVGNLSTWLAEDEEQDRLRAADIAEFGRD